MEQPLIDESLVRKYLLGQLAEGDRERLEERLLTDDDFYETVTALEDRVEDELIDQYLDGELTGDGRAHFERLLLYTPERADKLRLIKDLKALAVPAVALDAGAATRATTETPTPSRTGWLGAVGLFRNPLFGLSCAAALLFAVLSCVWLLVKSNRLEAELKQARAHAQPTPTADAGLKEQLEQLRAQNEELTAGLRSAEEARARLEQQVGQQASANTSREGTRAPARTERAGQQTSIATLVLSATLRGTQGGEKVATLAISRPGTPARLVLNVDNFAPEDYRRVRAVLKRSAGSEVWSSESVNVVIRQRKSRAVLTLPAGKLFEGLYTIDLEGVTDTGSVEPIGLYTFRVEDSRLRAIRP